MKTVDAGGPPGTIALYRYFDAEDALLYIGITGDLANREQSHIKASAWMKLTARSTVTRYPTRNEALDAETKAIKAEHPIFNVADNDTQEARRTRKEYEAAHADILVPPPVSASAPDETVSPRFSTRPPSLPSWPENMAAQILEPAAPARSCTSRIEVQTDGNPHAHIVILDVSDGSEGVQVYLSPSESHAIGEALIRHAAQAAKPHRPHTSTIFTEGPDPEDSVA